VYRNWITPDGAAGPTGDAGFRAAPDRYHLYVSHACPWAHRTLILRALKGLEQMLAISVVNWKLGAEGWSFQAGPGVIPDPLHSASLLSQIYRADPRPFDGHATTPLLWDKQQGRVVSTESADIVRMFNSAFDAIGSLPGDYYPALWAYTRDVYQMPAIRGTVHLDHIKHHYYESHPALDPTGIVPLGPELDFDSPHGREALPAA
jgi:putative glutathione S-transferase